MKIITLNTWGGRAGKENLLSFFAKYKDSVEVFCLQEIWDGGEHMRGVTAGSVPLDDIHPTLLSDIAEVLSDYVYYFRPHFEDYYGVAFFVRKEISLLEEGERFVHKFKDYVVSASNLGKHARNIQFIKIGSIKNPLTIINFHGLWNGEGKNDSEDRIIQSQNIIEFLKEQRGEVVFCGDFNLRPDTKSLVLFEEFGLQNLVKEYGVTSTRTSFYAKSERFADYIFVSKGIEVVDFKVLPEEVSDHAALLLEFKCK